MLGAEANDSIPADSSRRAVGGTVIHNDKLPLFVALLSNRSDGLCEILLTVESRDDNGDKQ